MSQEFTVIITGTENGEWQGRIIAPDGRQSGFCSLLELIRQIGGEARRTSA